MTLEFDVAKRWFFYQQSDWTHEKTVLKSFVLAKFLIMKIIYVIIVFKVFFLIILLLNNQINLWLL